MEVDNPISFYDLSWLALRGASPKSIVQALDLSDPSPATWRQGINAVAGDFWDLDAPSAAFLSRVFITPEVAGWRLAVGVWLGGSDREQPGRDVEEYCRQLSRAFGEAYSFTTQGRMDWYSWCLARSGEVYRHFLWAERLLVDRGSHTLAESQAREQESNRQRGWHPSERAVMAVAAECSISPLDLESMDGIGTGYIAVTKWGRQHGVPTRSMDE